MFPAIFNLEDLNGDNGFVINIAGDHIAYLGDINDDGLGDIGIGTSQASYVVYGSNKPWASTFDIGTLNGSNGFIINGLSCSSISAAGDMNLDGIDDFALGDATQESVFVVFGSKFGFPNSFDIKSLNGTNGFSIFWSETIGNTNGWLGNSISNFTNIDAKNNKGIVIGSAYSYDEFILSQQYNFAMNAYAIYASASPFSTSFDLASLDGSNGFMYTVNSHDACCEGAQFEDPLEGIAAATLTASSIGDINNDTYVDLGFAIYCSCSPEATWNSGDGFLSVIFGSEVLNQPIYSNLENIDLPDSPAAPSIYGSGLYISTTGGKDLNEDGIDDFAIGLPICTDYLYEYTPGLVVVYFGANNISYNNLNYLRSIQISPKGNDDSLGQSVAMSSDVNGDGSPDLLIGAPSYTSGYTAIAYGQANLEDLSVGELNGINGFIMTNETSLSDLGSSIAVGDINGDNITDMMIVGYAGFDSETNFSYVVFGGYRAPTTTSVPLSTTTSNSSHASSSEVLYDIIGGVAGGVAGMTLLGMLAWYAKSRGWFKNSGYEPIND